MNFNKIFWQDRRDKMLKKIISFSILLMSTIGGCLAVNTSSKETSKTISDLQVLNEKYKADTTINEDFELPHEITPDGGPDYTNYLDSDYYATTTFNRRNYFENLTKYSPNNNIRSCGYVSFIQLLSYYDTFYNDSIIPDKYDKFYENATTETEVKSYSPGVLKQQYYSSSGSYYKYCHDTMEEDFESKLTVIHNQLENTDNDGTHLDSNNKVVNNFTYSIGAWHYQSILNSLYGNTTNVKVNLFSNKTQAEYIQLAKDSINSGNPIIVHIQKKASDGTTSAHHSVVVYDYDEGGLYANFGWGSSSNHASVLGGAAGYNEIYYAATLDFTNMGHTHSNNYVINGKKHCGCNISDKVLCKVDTVWKNVPPTLYWMRNIYDNEETFDIGIRSSQFGSNIISYNKISKSQITISINDWKKIVNATTGNYFYIYIKRNSKLVNYNYEIQMFSKPSKTMQHFSISPAEYDYAQAYYNEEREQSITQGNYTFNTTRYRCGYIEGEYIVLSTRRAEPLKAYLNYSFKDFKVYKIEVDLTLWSATEYINSSNATAFLRYKTASGKWITAIDLLKDITLSTDRQSPNNYTFVFSEGATEFEFTMTCKYTSDRNKGRLCIGDLNVYLA